MMHLVIRILISLGQGPTVVTLTTIFHMIYLLSQTTATLGVKDATPELVGHIKTQP